MKKSLLLLPLAAVLLTGCMSGGGSSSKKKKSSTSSGGGNQPMDEAAAVERAKSYDMVTLNGGTAIFENEKTKIGHKNDIYTNDYLCLTTKQIISDKDTGKKFEVNVAWTYDDKASFIKEVITIDDNHKGIYFLYDAETHAFPFSAQLSCGDAKSDDLKFEVELQTKNLKFDHYSLAEIYKTTADGTNYELVDPSTGYYKSNNLPLAKYTCISTEGKVLYVAPDGNWALIGDGDYTLELYSGSALDLNETRYPALKVGNTVYVEAELSCYYGNLQISFIFDISNGDASKVKDSTGFKNLSASDFKNAHYWENGLMNSLYTVSATYKGNIVQDKKTVSDPSALKNGRFTFDVEVGGAKLLVAYDYHIDKSGNLGIFDAFKSKLTSWSVGSSVTLKGTLRFAGTANSDGYSGNETVTAWQLVPYLQDHLG